MTKESRIEFCRKIGGYYGLEDRLCMLMEECGELTQAANKVRRAYFKGENFENLDLKMARTGLIEEIADVSCLVDELKLLLDIRNDEIANWKDKKLERTLDRIK